MNNKSQLQLKYETLLAEQERRRNGFAEKAFAVIGAHFAVLGIFAASGLNSFFFISSALALALFLMVVGINSWGFHLNLRDAKRCLSKRN